MINRFVNWNSVRTIFNVLTDWRTSAVVVPLGAVLFVWALFSLMAGMVTFLSLQAVTR